MTAPRRRRRGAPVRDPLTFEPLEERDRVKDLTVSVITAAVFLVLLAFALIPVTKALVAGYRWALA